MGLGRWPWGPAPAGRRQRVWPRGPAAPQSPASVISRDLNAGFPFNPLFRDLLTALRGILLPLVGLPMSFLFLPSGC